MAKRKSVTIIGLTTFGEELAMRLAQTGTEVTVLDMKSEKIQQVAGEVAHAIVTDARDPENLAELDVDKSDLVVVAIREHLEMSVMVILALQELKAKNVLVLARNDAEEKVFRKLGVTKVTLPERDSARREAQLFLNPTTTQYLELAPGYSMVEVAVPREFAGKTLRELNVRARFHVNIVAVRSETSEANLFVPEPDHVFESNDLLLLIGPNEKIKEMINRT